MSIKQFLKSDFIKNAGLLFSSSGIAGLLMLLVVPVLTRLYKESEVHGDMANFLSIIAIGVAISTLKYEQAIMVESDRKKARNLVKLSLWLNVVWFLISSLLLFLFQQPLINLLGLHRFENWLYLIPITIFITGCVETLAVWWNRERKYKKLSVNRLAITLGSSGYKLIHKKLALFSVNGLVLGHAIGQIIGLILYIPRNFTRHLKTNWTELKELARAYKNFPLWAMPSTLINVIGTAMPLFLITYFIGRESTGYFANALKLTYIPMGMVSFAVGQVFFERLARLKEDQERHALSHNILRFLFFLSLIPVVAMVVWGDVITPFILGSDWQVSGQMTQIIVLFYFVMYLSSPFAAAFEVYNKLNLQFLFTSIFTASTTLGLFITLTVTHDVYMGLMAFCFIGILVRLAMLISCFRLIGQNLIGKMLFGLFIVAICVGLATFIRYSLF